MPRRATSPATPPPVRSAAPTGTRRRETDRGARHPAAGGAADATARSGACECHEAPVLLLPRASDDESASSGERADRVPPDEPAFPVGEREGRPSPPPGRGAKKKRVPPRGAGAGGRDDRRGHDVDAE